MIRIAIRNDDRDSLKHLKERRGDCFDGVRISIAAFSSPLALLETASAKGFDI